MAVAVAIFLRASAVRPDAGPAAAVQTPGAAAACADPEYHQLDFWTGRWDVYNPARARWSPTA